MGQYLFLFRSSLQAVGWRGCEAKHGGVPGGVRGDNGVRPGRPSGGGLVAAFDDAVGFNSLGLGEAVSVSVVLDSDAVNVLVLEQEVEARVVAELVRMVLVALESTGFFNLTLILTFFFKSLFSLLR